MGRWFEIYTFLDMSSESLVGGREGAVSCVCYPVDPFTCKQVQVGHDVAAENSAVEV